MRFRAGCLRLQLIEAIRPILPSIRNTPYGKRIQSKLAREDSSFSYGPGFGGDRGGRGGYRGGGGMQRHLGRPQLQHINALSEVYGSQGHYIPQGNHYMPHGGHPGQFRDMPTHTGVAYHAPGPDGQPWLHLRGPGGGPAPNWNVPGNEGMPMSDGSLSAEATGQVLPDSIPANGQVWNTDPNQYYAQQPPHPHHAHAMI